MAEQHQIESDMARFFDFTDAEMPDVQAIADFNAASNDKVLDSTFGSCPLHPNEICLCLETSKDFLPDHGFEINPPELDPLRRVPKFHRPHTKCDRCRTAKLDCFYSYEEQKACSSCTALFRPCSFVEAPSRDGVMVTLHTVDEDQVIERGGKTGIIALKSFNYAAASGRGDDSGLPSRKTGMRFSRSNIKILKDWMHKHNDHPYPTDAEKEELCSNTGLNPTQISNWLANTRRRTKQTLRSASPHVGSLSRGSEAINIRPNKDGLTHRSKEWENLNPLDRWKISPPEHDPAKLEDIAYAVATTDLDQPAGGAGPSREPSYRGRDSSGHSDSLSTWQCKSSASFDTGFSAISSGSYSNNSLVSSISHGSSRNSFGSKISKDRRRRRRTAANPSRKLVDDKRLFECTFCTDKFKSKYDWARHEKSLHLSLEKWICSPIGEVTTDPVTGARKCVFCNLENPDSTHLETHNYRSCEEKGLQSRTFYRKDHLRQHLRLMHNCKMIPAMEAWKSEAAFIKCRCGFCGAEFNRWADRVDHLAKHFRNGSQMKDWKGCRGLEPAVAAQVTNAMPPYLIGNEAKSPFPFSATNESSMHQLYMTSGVEEGLGTDLEALIPGQLDDGFAFTQPSSDVRRRISHSDTTPSLTVSDSQPTPPSGSLTTGPYQFPEYPLGRPTRGATTCWEILTVRLGRYVNSRLTMEPDAQFTDAELQREARIILYDEDDTWNQTAADNPEWLRLFRQAHNIATKGMLLDDFVDPIEDLGRFGEMSFDHFFNHKDPSNTMAFQGTMDDTLNLTAFDDMNKPLTDAELMVAAAATASAPPISFGSDFDMSLTSHGLGVGDMTAMSLGIDLQQAQKEIADSAEVAMMRPAVDMMELNCMFGDCAQTHGDQPVTTSA